jgi:coproporphyrinogen III oxidase-like Fe-S oxidoreductase
MVIPLIVMGAISAVSFIPSLLEKKETKEDRSQQVINQTGKQYFTRNGYRTNGLNVYSRPQLKDQKQNFNIMNYLPLIAVGIGAIFIIRKVF